MMEYDSIFAKVKIKILGLIRNLFNLVICWLAIVGLIAIFSRFFDVGGCLDLGGVWDEEYYECRFDCRKWNKETGCILLSDEELEKEVDRCKRVSNMSLYRCHMAKYELSKRQLRDKINNQDKKMPIF